MYKCSCSCWWPILTLGFNSHVQPYLPQPSYHYHRLNDKTYCLAKILLSQNLFNNDLVTVLFNLAIQSSILVIRLLPKNRWLFLTLRTTTVRWLIGLSLVMSVKLLTKYILLHLILVQTCVWDGQEKSWSSNWGALIIMGWGNDRLFQALGSAQYQAFWVSNYSQKFDISF